jgi:ribose transport system permease protein
MRKEIGMFCALVALCLVIGISNTDFFGATNLTNTSRQVAMLGIFAIGVGFVIITGGIDLSIGSVIGLTGVLIAKFSAPFVEGVTSGNGWPIGVGIALAMAVALTIGLVQGLLITRLNLQPFIVTLGGMMLIKGVSQVITGGGNISFGNHPFRALGDEGWRPLGFLGNPTPNSAGWWESLSNFMLSFEIPWPVLIFVAVALVATYVLHFSVFGRHLFAIGGNRDAALYSGVPVKRIECTTYVISAGLAGIAGIAYAAYIGQMSHSVGEGYELYAITAAVIGGCSLRGGEGTILGVMIGAAVIRVLDNGINMFKLTFTDAAGKISTWSLSDNWRNVIIGAVILVAVILDQMSHVLRNRKRTAQAQAKPAPVAVPPAK